MLIKYVLDEIERIQTWFIYYFGASGLLDRWWFEKYAQMTD